MRITTGEGRPRLQKGTLPHMKQSIAPGHAGDRNTEDPLGEHAVNAEPAALDTTPRMLRTSMG